MLTTKPNKMKTLSFEFLCIDKTVKEIVEDCSRITLQEINTCKCKYLLLVKIGEDMHNNPIFPGSIIQLTSTPGVNYLVDIVDVSDVLLIDINSNDLDGSEWLAGDVFFNCKHGIVCVDHIMSPGVKSYSVKSKYLSKRLEE